MNPFVSIVVPTYEREECLAVLLKNLFIQDYKDYEVIVIDQSSQLSENKIQLINLNKNKIRYFQIKEKGRSIAKNIGIQKSKGDIIIFCDDDILPPINFITTHVNNYKNLKIGAVSCRLVEDGQPSIRIKQVLESTWYGRFINRPYSTYSTFATSLNGGNMSFRRIVLEKVGYFEEKLIGTSMVEEPDIAFRVIKNGYKIYFDSSVTVLHNPQKDGNIATMNSKAYDWFENYSYNVLFHFAKYGRWFNIPFVFIYLYLVINKNIVFKGKGFVEGNYIFIKALQGLREGYHIYRNSTKIYYTPERTIKGIIIQF